jgi:hypothetical protein
MRAADQIHVVLLQEARHHVGTEGEGDTAVVFAPAGYILVRVGPEEVAQEAAVWNLRPKSALERRQEGVISGRILDEKGKLTSVGRITLRICSIEFKSGLNPPCMVKIFSSMMAAIGKQLKQSVNVFHSLMLYLRLHSS